RDRASANPQNHAQRSVVAGAGGRYRRVVHDDGVGDARRGEAGLHGAGRSDWPRRQVRRRNRGALTMKEFNGVAKMATSRMQPSLQDGAWRKVMRELALACAVALAASLFLAAIDAKAAPRRAGEVELAGTSNVSVIVGKSLDVRTNASFVNI